MQHSIALETRLRNRIFRSNRNVLFSFTPFFFCIHSYFSVHPFGNFFLVQLQLHPVLLLLTMVKYKYLLTCSYGLGSYNVNFVSSCLEFGVAFSSWLGVGKSTHLDISQKPFQRVIRRWSRVVAKCESGNNFQMRTQALQNTVS